MIPKAATTLVLARPEAGVSSSFLAKAIRIELKFAKESVKMEKQGDNLVFRFDDGGELFLGDFYTTYSEEDMPQFVVEGEVVDGSEFLASFEIVDGEFVENGTESEQQEQSQQHASEGRSLSENAEVALEEGVTAGDESQGAELEETESTAFLAKAELDEVATDARSPLEEQEDELPQITVAGTEDTLVELPLLESVPDVTPEVLPEEPPVQDLSPEDSHRWTLANGLNAGTEKVFCVDHEDESIAVVNGIVTLTGGNEHVTVQGDIEGSRVALGLGAGADTLHMEGNVINAYIGGDTALEMYKGTGSNGDLIVIDGNAVNARIGGDAAHMMSDSTGGDADAIVLNGMLTGYIGGDSAQNMNNSTGGARDSVTVNGNLENAFIGGDAAVNMTGGAGGDSDVIVIHGDFTSSHLGGDAGVTLSNAQGGSKDSITIDGTVWSGYIGGDAGVNMQAAIGGNDSIFVKTLQGGVVAGDAGKSMNENSRGGNDVIVVSEMHGGYVVGDAHTFESATAGSDTISIGLMTGGSVAGDAIVLHGTNTAATAGNHITVDSFGGSGKIVIDGGIGNADTFSFGIGNDHVKLKADNTVDFLEGGDDTRTGGSVTITNVEIYDGGAGNDLIDASEMTQGLTLRGGLGNDTIIGGSAADVFAWSMADFAADTPSFDVILKFSSVQEDKIDLGDILTTEGCTVTLSYVGSDTHITIANTAELGVIRVEGVHLGMQDFVSAEGIAITPPLAGDDTIMGPEAEDSIDGGTGDEPIISWGDEEGLAPEQEPVVAWGDAGIAAGESIEVVDAVEAPLAAESMMGRWLAIADAPEVTVTSASENTPGLGTLLDGDTATATESEEIVLQTVVSEEDGTVVVNSFTSDDATTFSASAGEYDGFGFVQDPILDMADFVAQPAAQSSDLIVLQDVAGNDMDAGSFDSGLLQLNTLEAPSQGYTYSWQPEDVAATEGLGTVVGFTQGSDLIDLTN